MNIIQDLKGIMNLELILSQPNKEHGLSEQVTFWESFLRFASYAEEDNSLYPYWRIFSEKDKFKFIDDSLVYLGDTNVIDYVLHNKKSFWLYMIDNSEFNAMERDWGIDLYYSLGDYKTYYIPCFTVNSIAFLGGLNTTDCPHREKIIFGSSGCKEAKAYFELLFKKFQEQFDESESVSFTAMTSHFKASCFPSIQASIMRKIDELITG